MLNFLSATLVGAILVSAAVNQSLEYFGPENAWVIMFWISHAVVVGWLILGVVKFIQWYTRRNERRAEDARIKAAMMEVAR